MAASWLSGNWCSSMVPECQSRPYGRRDFRPYGRRGMGCALAMHMPSGGHYCAQSRRIRHSARLRSRRLRGWSRHGPRTLIAAASAATLAWMEAAMSERALLPDLPNAHDCLVCGPNNPIGFRLQFWTEDERVVTEFVA